jgi:acyl carrier protein
MQAQETKQRLCNVMASVFKCTPDTITAQAQLHKFPRWDSLAHIQLVLALETEFRIKIRDAEMVRLNSFDKLMTHLGRAAASSSQ